MTVKELIQKIEAKFPLDKAAPWDNSGFQAGRKNKEVKKVYVALDATEEVIDDAVKWGADIIVTHHPMTMDGIKSVTSDTLKGRKYLKLLSHDVCCYASHTNYDIVEMASLAGSMMKLQKPEILDIAGVDQATAEYIGFGRAGSLVRPVTVRECGELVKTIFKLDNVKIFGDLDQVIQRVAISPGSGKSMIGPALKAKAQVLITGDIGHHEGIDAVDEKLAIIDAGHYGLEHIFIDHMAAFIQKEGKELEIRKAPIESPFQVI
ncbi:MAG: Nif3-like dinuclear metal center hexameric protein [Eubacteriales bacterium]|nr:Nif3-like dinuclear metal center hexameric protein [Eubacteriales bacterium]